MNVGSLSGRILADHLSRERYADRQKTPKREKHKSKVNMKFVNDILEELGFDPYEELAKIAHKETFLEADPMLHFNVLKELTSYQRSKTTHVKLSESHIDELEDFTDAELEAIAREGEKRIRAKKPRKKGAIKKKSRKKKPN